MLKTLQTIQNAKKIKDIIRDPVKYFPSTLFKYEKIAVNMNGNIICKDCLEKNYKDFLFSTLFDLNTEKNIVAIGYDYLSDETCFCNICNKPLFT